MDNFAVMHTTKMGSGGGGIGSHIDRTQKKLPKNVDSTRVHLNKEYVATGGTMAMDVKRRIEDGYKSVNKNGTPRLIRKDAVKAVGIILSGSNKRMKEIEQSGDIDRWAKANLEFIENKIGKKNIVRFTLHRDEKTPHIHCVFVPLDKDGNLTAKEIVGDKKKLSQLQTDYGEAMKSFGLARGIKNSRMNHTTTREYYRDISNKSEEIEIQTNVMGHPKKGEEERLQEIYQVMATEIYESERLLKKEKNLKPQWEQRIKEQHNSLNEKNQEAEKTLNEAQRLEQLQKDIIIKNIKDRVAVEKSRLDKLWKTELDKLKEKYKGKESMLDEMVKAKHVNRTLDLLNDHIKTEFGAKYKITYNEEKDSFFKKSLEKENQKKSKGRGYSR